MRFLHHARSPRALALAASALLAVGLSGAPASAAPADTATISGRVTDAVTGQPIENANVTPLSPSDPWNDVELAHTDANGEFVVTGVPAGTWHLRFDHSLANYVAVTSGEFEVADGEQVTGRDVRLTPGAAITGRAVDSVTGEPLESIICPSTFVGRTSRNAGTSNSCTGTDGRFEASAIPAGPVTVYFSGSTTHVPIWAVGAATQARATVYRVTAGQTIDIGDVPIRRGGVVAGRVTNRAGEPVAGATVRVLAGTCDPTCDEAVSDADGRYRIENVRPGVHTAKIVAPAPYAWQWSGGASTPEGARRFRVGYGTTTQLDVVLKPQATLRVNVPGLDDSVFATAHAYTLSGEPVGTSRGIGSGFAVLAGLPAGRVKVRVTVFPEAEEPRTYWYGGTSVENATPVAVAPNRNASVTIDISE